MKRNSDNSKHCITNSEGKGPSLSNPLKNTFKDSEQV